MLNNKLNSLLEEKYTNNQFSGVVLIRRDNETLFSQAYGYANRAWKVKNTLETKFRIASISKMFTAVSILQLIENKELSLDTKVVEYLDIKNTRISDDITIYDLLTHTSGMADYYDEDGSEEGEWERMWAEKPIYTVRELKDYFDLFAFKESVSKLGEKFNYNGAGYILLGMVIEKASKQSYFDYVRENIFTKINMKDTDFLALDTVQEGVAEGYEANNDTNSGKTEWKRNIYTTTPEAASDGGATSTAEDLVKFIQTLRNNGLLSEKMTKEILSPHVLDEKSNGFRKYIWKYGYGNYFILDNEENVVRGGHPGEEYGVSCRLYYYPKSNIDVVILGNQGLCAGSIGWAIHDMIDEYGL